MDAAIALVCERFGITKVKVEQRQGIEAVISGHDVFGCFPTGFGKSLIYQALPTVAKALRGDCFETPPFVIVVCPLKALMRDQIDSLRLRGCVAAEIGFSDAEDGLIMGEECEIVYGSPEKFLTNDKWRSFLQLPQIQRRVIAVVADEVHTVLEWGESSAGVEAFRPWCGKVGEIRALVGRVPMLALTATVTRQSRAKLIRKLGMSHCREIVLSPDRANIRIFVRHISNDIEEVFKPLLQLLKMKGNLCPRVLIYCKCADHCSNLFSYFLSRLKDRAYWPRDGVQLVRTRLFAMYHSTSAEKTKADVLESLRHPHGTTRVVFATTALGMGIDIKGLYTVVHYGLPKSVEEYEQQMGRAGRDGAPSSSILLWNKHLCRHASAGMREILANRERQCQRQLLLEQFASTRSAACTTHNCCDVCEARCSSGACSLHEGITFVSTSEGLSSQLGERWSETKVNILRFELRQITYEHVDSATGVSSMGSLTEEEIGGIVAVASKITEAEDLNFYVNLPSDICSESIFSIITSL